MEFQDVLRQRRMVRNYLPDPVAKDALERIVQAGRKAPSAGFSQGTAFVIVTDPALRQAIANLCEEPSYVTAGFDPWISRAPAHIVICISEDAYHQRYREPDKVDKQGNEIGWPVPFWWVDAGAALMLVLLTAVDEGLAAGFLGTDADELRSLLRIPDSMFPIGIVTVGRSAPDRRSNSLKRGWRSDEQVVHWQTWTP
jgi:FMN reductase [NAD(P)H]